MNQIYRYIGYSKQAFHQKMNRWLREHEQQLQLLPIIAELRQEHPGVAARELYLIHRPGNIGRDRYEKLCFEHGFKLKRTRCYKRTTDSSGVIRYPNLIVGKEFTGINQAWSSDITYYQIADKVYYITFIIDLFSRRIVGFSVSKRLFTEHTTIPALTMALKERNPAPGLIFHSDGGGQYYSDEFVDLTSDYDISNSMCDIVYENAHAERINGTIKNQYLKGYYPHSYESLIEMTRRAVNNYNCIRPHKSLKKISPIAFENLLPAGGISLSNDDFCISSNHSQQQFEKSSSANESKKTNKKTVEKTVNVI